MSEITLSGPKIYSQQGILHDRALVIKNGLIDRYTEKIAVNRSHVLHFPASYLILPGFIDLHIHGANNDDVMDSTGNSLDNISQALLAEGVTGFLATTMTASSVELEKALGILNDFSQKKKTNFLGIHLEGPFISPKKAGAQQAQHILPPNISKFKKWQKMSGDNIKIVTLAPELPNALTFIAYLRKHNIIAALGHTDATYEETLAAIEKGANYITHLFNAMRGLHHRDPGILAAALLNENLWTELIVDGIHLHPAIVKLVLKLKSKDKILLVTDAMRAKCLGDGCYSLGGQKVEVKNKTATLADGTLAGSILRMPEALTNMLNFTQTDLSAVVQMTSANPAKILGLYNKKGGISIGKDADLVVLDDKYQVQLTLLGGETAYIK